MGMQVLSAEECSRTAAMTPLSSWCVCAARRKE
jgi:hypothetical protein